MCVTKNLKKSLGFWHGEGIGGRLGLLCPPIPSRADSAPVFYACRPQSRQRPRVTFAWRALTRSCGQKSLVPRSVYGCGREGIGGKGWEPRYRHPSPSPCPSNQENLLKIPGIFLVPWDGKTGLSFNHYIILSSPCHKNPRDFLGIFMPGKVYRMALFL